VDLGRSRDVRYSLAFGDPLADVTDGPYSNEAFGAIVGDSSALRKAVDEAAVVAAREAHTVLLVGEAGTGKELLARAIHASGSRRPGSAAPFIPIDCASLPPRLLEAELFGRESGSFGAGQSAQGLLEVARTGTVYLENIGELPENLQPKLLRAIEDRTVRRVGGHDETPVACRVIAASRTPVDQGPAAGRLRHDLTLRLSLARIELPPLRERRGDVHVLARHFLEEKADAAGLGAGSIGDDALRVLESHTWPGNVRELRTVIRQAALSCQGATILAEHLRISQRTSFPGHETPSVAGYIPIPSEGRSLESVEDETVRLTLRLTRWNQSAAARILEISRPTLARKIEIYGITQDDGATWGRRG
jgi:DNA-binding NtrC family response regulator